MTDRMPPSAERSAPRCAVCADEGVAMRVLGLDEAAGLALCAAPAGARASVEIALVEPVAIGERLLVHAGVAIARLGPEPAAAPAPRRAAAAAGGEAA